jgi:dihydrofolate reductase
VSRVIVVQFVSTDGITQDPDGTQGFKPGNWAFRTGPEAVKGDKFRLGVTWDTGVVLLGRRTWEHFSQLWPSRTQDFARKLNAITKLVVSNTLESVDAWSNSVLLRGNLVDEVRRRKLAQDLIVIGSDSVVQTLMRHDLVDEYRLLIFPIVLGEGRRLFKDSLGPIQLHLERVEQVGEGALLTYRRLSG